MRRSVADSLIKFPVRAKTTDHAVLKTQVDTGGGGGDDGRMEARIARLEATIEHAQRDISDIKQDVREMRSSMRTDFLITWGGLIAGILGLAGLMAKGFHWL